MVTAAAPAKQATATSKDKSATPPTVEVKALLPDAFAGWVAAEQTRTVTDASLADRENAVALKEYDFTDGALATYKRGGETLTIHALRFHDLSGAYGAYSFYRENGWPKAEIGAGATSNKNRVLFWQGSTVVDATFSHLGPMSAAELRELANQFPMPQGNKALTPPILTNLPQALLDQQTTHYALGPAGYAGSGGVLPPDLVGFDRDAETVTANYTLRSGPATLTIIDYPTPQMAQAQEARIRAYIKAGSQAQPPWPKPLTDSDRASLEVRRSGPCSNCKWRRDSRGEPQTAGEGSLRGGSYGDSPAHRFRSLEDRTIADGNFHPGLDRMLRCNSNGILFGRRQSAVSNCERQASLIGLRRGVYPAALGRVRILISKHRVHIGILKVNGAINEWKTSFKPEERPLKRWNKGS